MKVWIDRDICRADLPTYLGCLDQIVHSGTSEHACITEFESDGSKDLIVFTHSEGQDREPLIIPQTLLNMIAYEYREGVLAPKVELDL